MSVRSMDTLDDARLFRATRNVPVNIGTAQEVKIEEVVCSSSKFSMSSRKITTALRLFSQTIYLDPHRLEVWPTSTSICCWHDTEPFSTTPLSIPKSQLHGDDEMVYVVYGVFCSVECAARWIITNHRDAAQILLRFNRLLVEVYKMDPVSVFEMKLAPDAISLTKFGGPYTLEAFRAKNKTVVVELLEPPFITYDMVLQEHARDVGGLQPLIPVGTGHQIRNIRRPSSLSRRGHNTDNTLLQMVSPENVMGENTEESTGVCTGLIEGGLFRSFLANAAAGELASACEHAENKDKSVGRPVLKKKGKSRAVNASAVAIAEVKASGRGHGTLAQFIRNASVKK